MKAQKLCMLASAFSAAILSMGTAQAADVTTEDVKVTAGRVEQELMDVNMSVGVMTEDEIAQSSAKTIADMLDDIPGVEVQNDGSQGLKRISIRGMGTFRTVLMIDGQRITEHKSMSGTPILIDPSAVERIEVIKGPASVLYGSDAIGGAINIITKKHAERPLQGEAAVGLDTSGSGKTASGSIYGTASGWTYRLNASVENYGDLETPIGKAENTDFSSRSGSLFLAYDVNENIRIGGTLDTYDLDTNSGIQVNRDTYDDFYVKVPEWRRSKGALFYEQKNVSDYLARVRVDVFHQKTHKEMENRVYLSPMPPMKMHMDNAADNDLKQSGVSIQTDWTLGEHYIIAGYDFSYDDLDATSDYQNLVKTNKMPFFAGDQSLGHYDASQTQHALYVSAESPIGDTVKVNYGVRYNWVKGDADNLTYTYTVANGQTYGGPTTSSSHNSSSDGKAVFNLGTIWYPVDNLALRASWAQGYRFPIMQELYIDTAMGGSLTYANPQLKPETSDNFEIGARWNADHILLDAALFYSKTKDFISTVTVGEDISRYENISDSTSYGLEASVSLRDLPLNFEPYTDFTFMRRKNEQDGGISTYDSGISEITARYGVRWSGNHDGLGLHADAYAVSRSGSDEVNLTTGKLAQHIGGSTTYNLTAGVSFGPQKDYSLNVGLYNITDKLYTKSGSTYEAGRYFTVKLNARF